MATKPPDAKTAAPPSQTARVQHARAIRPQAARQSLVETTRSTPITMPQTDAKTVALR